VFEECGEFGVALLVHVERGQRRKLAAKRRSRRKDLADRDVLELKPDRRHMDDRRNVRARCEVAAAWTAANIHELLLTQQRSGLAQRRAADAQASEKLLFLSQQGARFALDAFLPQLIDGPADHRLRLRARLASEDQWFIGTCLTAPGEDQLAFDKPDMVAKATSAGHRSRIFPTGTVVPA